MQIIDAKEGILNFFQVHYLEFNPIKEGLIVNPSEEVKVWALLDYKFIFLINNYCWLIIFPFKQKVIHSFLLSLGWRKNA